MTENLRARIYVLDPVNSVFDHVAEGNYGPATTVHRFCLRDDVGRIEELAASTACCVVLALPFPGPGSGADEQEDEAAESLRRLSSQFPTVAVGGRGDAAFVEQALRLSVTDTVFLPARPGQIIQAVDTALQLDRQFLPARIRHAAVARLMQLLSTRESEVMDLLVRGRSSKEIGAELEIGVQTVLKHRAHLLKKMGLRNDVELALTVQEFRSWPVHQRPSPALISLTRPESGLSGPSGEGRPHLDPSGPAASVPDRGGPAGPGFGRAGSHGAGLGPAIPDAVQIRSTFRLNIGATGR